MGTCRLQSLQSKCAWMVWNMRKDCEQEQGDGEQEERRLRKYEKLGEKA